MGNKKTRASISDLISNNITPLEATIRSVTTEKQVLDQNLQTFKAPTETLITIHPLKCIPWEYHDRSEPELDNIDNLAISISKYGQQEPILVRPLLPKKNNIEYEIIFGNRRWKACCSINKPIKAILKNINNQEAAAAQKEENENRQDISNYSKAFHYNKLIEKKVFLSKEHLSKSLGIPNSTLADLLSYTRINKKILETFKNPHKIKQSHAIILASISSKVSDSQIDDIMKIVPEIEDRKISKRNLSKRINQIITGNTINKNLDQVNPLFNIKKFDKEIQIIIPNNVVQNLNMSLIKKKLNSFLTKYKINGNENEKFRPDGTEEKEPP